LGPALHFYFLSVLLIGHARLHRFPSPAAIAASSRRAAITA
jgi:hypothetical protein